MWLFSNTYYFIRIQFEYQQVAAIVFTVTGLLCILVSAWRFKSADTTVNPMRPSETKTLVTKGLYRFSRNPMYFGMLLLLVGWAILLFTLTSWLGIPLFIWYMNQFQIKPEEAILQKTFGEGYQKYMAQVRRWI